MPCDEGVSVIALTTAWTGTHIQFVAADMPTPFARYFRGNTSLQ